MSVGKKEKIDSNNEIQEFFRENIVEKISAENNRNVTEIISKVDEMSQAINSLKSTGTTTGQDVSYIIQNALLKGDIDELNQKIDKDVIKPIKELKQKQSGIANAIPDGEKIVNSLHTKMSQSADEKISPIKETIDKCENAISEANVSLASLATKEELESFISQKVQDEIENIDNVLECVKTESKIQQNNMDVLSDAVKHADEYFRKKIELIIQNQDEMKVILKEFNQKFLYLLLIEGIGMMFIIGALIKLLFKML